MKTALLQHRNRRSPQRDGTRGFTLVEVMIAATIMVLVITNVSMVSRTTTEAARNGAFTLALEDELNLTLDRIALALMSSTQRELDPAPMAPNHSNRIDYRTSLGVEQNGNEIMGEAERIEWSALPLRPGRIQWYEMPGEPGERSVVWSNSVPDLYMDEIMNGEDDNGNDLPDEGGLSFFVDGDQIHIFLTVAKLAPNGTMIPAERTVNVTCRN